MSLGIEAYLDEQAGQRVGAMWKRLADLKLSAFFQQSAAEPHITFAVLEEPNIDLTEKAVEDFIQEGFHQPISFYGLGIFSTDKPVIFLAPVVSQTLLQRHY